MYDFNFKCQKCGEQFRVQFRYMLQKENIVCPNCSNTFPEESFRHIKAVATSLEEYGKLEMGSGNKLKHFNLSIQQAESS